MELNGIEWLGGNAAEDSAEGNPDPQCRHQVSYKNDTHTANQESIPRQSSQNCGVMELFFSHQSPLTTAIDKDMPNYRKYFR